MKKEVVLNQLGYFEVKDKPSEQELKDYYEKKYYQEGETKTYQSTYSERELAYTLNKIEQRHSKLIELGILDKNKTYSVLDIGCGEGFTLKYFRDLNWDVLGIDYSDYGCQSINPGYAQYLKKGDVYETIDELIVQGKKYDVLWLKHVLEHVIDPNTLLEKLHQLSSQIGTLIVEVPNDFSVIQKHLLKNDFIDSKFWIVTPDHLSYFNAEGLKNICNLAGWNYETIMGDFPIDLFLLNENSNYVRKPEVGKQAHYSRVEFENLIHSISVEKTNKFYEVMADLGIGREIIGIFSSHRK